MLDQKIIYSTMFAIVGTGAILNLAGSGLMGSLPARAAKFVTEGYGV